MEREYEFRVDVEQGRVSVYQHTHLTGELRVWADGFAQIDVDWGSESYWDRWERTDSADRWEYTGTCDGYRALPSWADAALALLVG